jgi:hypothetical protein
VPAAGSRPTPAGCGWSSACSVPSCRCGATTPRSPACSGGNRRRGRRRRFEGQRRDSRPRTEAVTVPDSRPMRSWCWTRDDRDPPGPDRPRERRARS